MRTALIAVLVALIPMRVAGGRESGRPEAAVDALFKAIDGVEAPGAVVLVARGGCVLLEKAWGLANLELGVPNSPESRFRIGSVTKPFTAAAVLLLAQEGRLGLDDPVALYLADYPHGSDITIRHLLTHTSGLPDFVSVEESGRLPLDAEPGTRLNYSNTGYSLLGRIVEQVAEQPFESYLRAKLFIPLGMADTGVDAPRALIRRRTAGYVRGESGQLLNAPLGDAAPDPFAGGISSTVRDLHRFVEGLASGTIVRRDLVAEAWTPVILPAGRRGGYGYGWMIGSFRGLREVGHGGDIDGFNAWLAVYPDVDATIVVLSNLSMHAGGPLPPAAALGHEIAAIYLGDVLSPDAPANLELPTDVLDRHAGRYRLEAPKTVLDITGGELTIVREGGRLIARDRTTAIPLRAESEMVFASTASPVTITFIAGAGGRTQEALISVAGLREFRAVRMD